MADKLTGIRIKKNNNTYSDQIPIWTKAQHVAYDEDNTVSEVLGNIDTSKGTIGEQLNSLRNNYTAVQYAVGSPLVATTVADMTDINKIYIYTGTTSGSFINGHWYYYNNTLATPAWSDGGIYNNTAVETDKTLSIENKAADAKAVSELIQINESSTNATKVNINTTNSQTYSLAEISDLEEIKTSINSLNNQFIIEKNINLDEINKNILYYHINNNNKWIKTNSSPYSTGFFMSIFKNIKYFKIKANNNNNSEIAFTINTSSANNTSVNFASGTSKVIIPQEEEQLLQVPENAQYLWIQISKQDNSEQKDVKPEYIKSISYKEAVKVDPTLLVQDAVPNTKTIRQLFYSLFNYIRFDSFKDDYSIIINSYFNLTTGEIAASTKYARTNILFNSSDIAAIDLNDDTYQYRILYYDENDNYLEQYSEYNSGLMKIPKQVKKFSLNIRRVDQTDINRDFLQSLFVLSATDATLSLNNKSADAKAVGNRLSNIESTLNQTTNYIQETLTDFSNSKANAIGAIASGDLVKIQDGGKGLKIKSFVINMNYNPSGYTNLRAVFSGRNILPNTIPIDAYKGSFSNSAIAAGSSSSTIYTFSIPCKHNGFYKIYQASKCNWKVAFSNSKAAKGVAVFEAHSMENQLQYELHNIGNYDYITIQASQSVINNFENNKCSITYENYQEYFPYTGLNIIDINFNNEIEEPIYGGTFDIITGKLISMFTSNGSQLDQYHQFYLSSTPIIILDKINYAWSTIGNISINYSADTKEYIDNILHQVTTPYSGAVYTTSTLPSTKLNGATCWCSDIHMAVTYYKDENEQDGKWYKPDGTELIV